MEVKVCDPEHDLYLRLPQGSTAQVAILQAGSVSVGEVELIQWSFPDTPLSSWILRSRAIMRPRSD